MRKPPIRSNATGSVQEKRGYLYTVISVTIQAIVQVLALPDYSEACRPRPLPVVEGIVVDVLTG